MHPWGFDPDQPGARRLAQHHLATLRPPVTVRLLERFTGGDGITRSIGENIDLPSGLARILVDAGVAERAT